MRDGSGGRRETGLGGAFLRLATYHTSLVTCHPACPIMRVAMGGLDANIVTAVYAEIAEKVCRNIRMNGIVR